MLISIIVSLVFILAAGYGAKIYADRDHTIHISRNEAIVAIVVSCVIGIPISITAVYKYAKGREATYLEFLNGRELAAKEIPITCSRDGPCRHEYSCDPYQVTYSCNCDKDGCDTCTRTEYHQCPYVVTEYDYRVETTVGSFTIDTHRFPVDYQQRRWRARREIPERIASQAGVGPPQFWIQARDRLQAGNPWAVTRLSEYTNYILATRNNIVREDAPTLVDRYREILPEFDNDIHDFYVADKVYGIGPWDRKQWVDVVNKFNASFSFFEGDLHLVFVDARRHTVQPDEYMIALETFWQREELGNEPLAKNTVVIALGVSEDTVQWARATTGMPVGNEGMLIAIRDELPGYPFTTQAMFGDIDLASHTPDYGDGVISTLLATNQVTKFTRHSMSNFQYLFNEIPVPVKWRILTGLFAALLSLPVWGIMLFHGGDPNYRRYRWTR